MPYSSNHSRICQTNAPDRLTRVSIDGIAVGFGSLTKAISQGWRRLENGYVRSYALSILVGVVLIFTYLVLR